LSRSNFFWSILIDWANERGGGVKNLGEEGFEEKIKKTYKYFIPHQDGEVKVCNGNATSIVGSIREMTRCCKTETDHIEAQGKNEKLPVNINLVKKNQLFKFRGILVPISVEPQAP